MRARAKELGGKLEISSNDETGTTVLLKVPLAARVTSRDGRVR
jgi:signal transduction histidine kinase